MGGILVSPHSCRGIPEERVVELLSWNTACCTFLAENNDSETKTSPLAKISVFSTTTIRHLLTLTQYKSLTFPLTIQTPLCSHISIQGLKRKIKQTEAPSTLYYNTASFYSLCRMCSNSIWTFRGCSQDNLIKSESVPRAGKALSEDAASRYFFNQPIKGFQKGRVMVATH